MQSNKKNLPQKTTLITPSKWCKSLFLSILAVSSLGFGVAHAAESCPGSIDQTRGLTQPFWLESMTLQGDHTNGERLVCNYQRLVDFGFGQLIQQTAILDSNHIKEPGSTLTITPVDPDSWTPVSENVLSCNAMPTSKPSDCHVETSSTLFSLPSDAYYNYLQVKNK